MVSENVLKISYSTLPDLPIPWNTAELFEAACKLGFDGIKGDVTPSSDGRLIMCHDSFFSMTENGLALEPGDVGVCKKRIYRMTAAQCKNLEYANAQAEAHLGYRAKVAELEDLIRICKQYGKIAYITVRDRRIEQCVDEVYRLLRKYDMTRQCIINSFSVKTLAAMRAKDASIRLSLVFGPNKILTKSHIHKAMSLGNCVVCLFWSRETLMAGHLLEKSKNAIAYAKEKAVELHFAHAWDIESYQVGLRSGFCGFQCTSTTVL